MTADIQILTLKEAIYKRPVIYFGTDLSAFVRSVIDNIVIDVDGKLLGTELRNDNSIRFKIMAVLPNNDWYQKRIVDTYLSEILVEYEYVTYDDIIDITMKFEPNIVYKYFLMQLHSKPYAAHWRP